MQFAADHPELVRKLVLQSVTAWNSALGKELVCRARDCALEGKWGGSLAAMMDAVFRPTWYKPLMLRVGAPLLALGGVTDDPSDFAIAVDAEMQFEIADRLGEITAPTLLVLAERDLEIMDGAQETAEAIPQCELIQYPNMSHPARGPDFERDVLAFLAA